MNDQTPPPSHAMWNIPQSEHYSVFIDETVSKNSRYTHFVAVAFPDLKKAPAPKGKHATSEGIETLKSDFNALQHSECGILGTTFSLQKTNSQWLSSVLKTAKTVLAILCRRNREAPLLTVSFYVEQYSQIEAPSAENLTAPKKKLNSVFTAYNQTLALLMKSEFETAQQQLDVRFEIVPKAEDLSRFSSSLSKSELRKSYYSDLIANIWKHAKSPALPQSNEWKSLAPCLLDERQTITLTKIADDFESAETPYLWKTLFLQTEGSWQNFLLRQIGEKCRTNVAMWKRFLQQVLGHIDSKAVNMPMLAAQVKWLEACRPKRETLPPTLRLLFLTAKLAEHNHEGGLPDVAVRKEFDELAKTLKRENVRLVAKALLHMAVSETNAFRFKEARELLLPLKKLPPIALGVQLEGQLCSSLGQCEAFLGDNKTAVKYFDDAIVAFRQLSNQEIAAGEIDQTRSYKVIALMDSCDGSKKSLANLEKEMIAYLGEADLAEAAKKIAVLRAPKERDRNKYRHHVLLRYFASGFAPQKAVDAYKSVSRQWAPGDSYHPWELIEFYRGVVFSDSLSLNKAGKICVDAWGTLKIIASVLCAAAAPLQLKPWTSENQYAVLRRFLPERAVKRIENWVKRATGAETDAEKLKLVADVLPFNFR